MVSNVQIVLQLKKYVYQGILKLCMAIEKLILCI